MTPQQEQDALLQDYRQVPRSVIDDLLCKGADADPHEAPGYLKAVAEIVRKQRTAKREKNGRASD